MTGAGAVSEGGLSDAPMGGIMLVGPDGGVGDPDGDGSDASSSGSDSDSGWGVAGAGGEGYGAIRMYSDAMVRGRVSSTPCVLRKPAGTHGPARTCGARWSLGSLTRTTWRMGSSKVGRPTYAPLDAT